MPGTTRSGHKRDGNEPLANPNNDTPEKRGRGRPRKDPEEKATRTAKPSQQDDNDDSWLHAPTPEPSASEEDLLLHVLSNIIAQKIFKR